MQIDHLMWACANLEQGCAYLAKLTGVTPIFSGRHPGLGTANALLKLGSRCYLEVIAPDPTQPLVNNFGARLMTLKTSGLLSWALNTQDLEGLRSGLKQAGFTTSRVQATSRESPQGESLHWQLLFVTNLALAPFFIDWLDCLHPAIDAPFGCRLQALELASPTAAELSKLCGQVPGLVINEGPLVSQRARLDTPRGEVWLEALTPNITLV